MDDIETEFDALGDFEIIALHVDVHDLGADIDQCLVHTFAGGE